MERLTLKSLHFHAYHGYYPREREEGNDFEIDLIFSANLRPAGDSDDLRDTVDYQKVTQIAASVMEGESVKLIETLAKRIGDRLFEHFEKVEALEVRMRKLNPPLDVETAYSEITMQWPR
ncbi:MAG: dihydroneopterin aldolase [Fodinibius sp.]|nr:dihydroneopterin aldolase [Fodinibius sp.]